MVLVHGIRDLIIKNRANNCKLNNIDCVTAIVNMSAINFH